MSRLAAWPTPRSTALDAADPALRRLGELRENYHRLVRAHVAPEAFVDKALTARGAAFVLQVLEQRAEWCTGATPGGTGTSRLRMLDMGLGFSTAAILRWMAEPREASITYVGVDHDHQWLEFIRREVVAGGSHDLDVVLACRAPGGRHRAPWMLGSFDVILVDHGDGKGTDLQTRAADSPWLSTLLKSDGIMLFDDWRPKHEGRIRRALGEGWSFGSAEWTRRFERDKAIGWAFRDR